MADTPEDVYHDAAHAMIGAQGYKVSDRTRRELAAGWWRRDDFRRAVDVAFGAGRDYQAKGEWR